MEGWGVGSRGQDSEGAGMSSPGVWSLAGPLRTQGLTWSVSVGRDKANQEDRPWWLRGLATEYSRPGLL